MANEEIVKKLVDLRRSKKEKQEVRAMDSSPEEYPYGTRISFDEEEVKKLGIADLKVGERVQVVGVGSVKSVNIREEENSKKRHDISIQIKKAVIRRKGKK